MPELSYSDPAGNFILDHAGSRNVLVSHWHGFSLVLQRETLILVALISSIFPDTILYFVGFEFAVLLLPIAHGWQHIPQHRNGRIVQTLFMCLESLGLVANKTAHRKHHNYRGATVYQDFSSSGLYSAKIDAAVNRFWDRAFHGPNRPFDNMKTTIYAIYMFCIVLLPIMATRLM